MVDCFLLSCSSACMTRLTTFRDDIKSSPERENRLNFSTILIALWTSLIGGFANGSSLLSSSSPFPLTRARSKGCFCFGNSKTNSSGPYSSLRTSLAAFFCSPNLRGKCAFLHTKTQRHFLLRHSFLQFFKGIVLVFHRSFVVRTFESCHLAFVTQMKPFFLGCLLSFDYFVWITFQNLKRYFTHTVGGSRFKLQLAK